MTAVIEVFADVTCPFAHAGLQRIVSLLAERGDGPLDVWIRAWPLEWVNGSPLDAEAVATKATILTERLGIDSFEGFDPAVWPYSTIPALNLTAAAYAVDHATGLAVGLALRAALFRQGRDVGDPAVLASIADEYGLPASATDAVGTPNGTPAVRADYAEGQRRGVRGSPHYWVARHDFFCPALVIGHDDHGGLTADFDPAGLAAFLDAATT
jgi:predicted DsbA family dithiol-disulfide isomerase